MTRGRFLFGLIVLSFGMMPICGSAQVPSRPPSAGPAGPDPEPTSIGNQDGKQTPPSSNSVSTKVNKHSDKLPSGTGNNDHKISGGADVNGGHADPSKGHADGNVATGADVAAHAGAESAGGTK